MQKHMHSQAHIKKKIKVISINKKYGDEQMWKNDR